jgi:phospholipid transport system substrate-binding protein
MKVSRILIAATFALSVVAAPALPAPQAASAPAAAEGPSQTVEDVAQGILKALEGNRDVYRKDPAKMQQLVGQYLLPHLDTETAARLVLGSHWQTATPDQRQRFINAFYHSMLGNYGTALAEFTADRMKVFPSTPEPGKDRATVRSEIKRDNGDRIEVNYRMILTPKGWQAYDVSIDGISYVKSYHDDFGSQIDSQGLDAVISRLEKGEKPGALSKASLGGKP